MTIYGTLIYCLQDDRVLLMKRNKQPNLGQWVGPGGKIEPGEAPFECARRELQEETGLIAHEMHFRGLITEVSPRLDWQWMLFIYVVTRFSGDLQADEREGGLHWWALDEIPSLDMPYADRIFFPHIIDITRPFYEAKCFYDADLNLLNVDVSSGF